MSKAAAFKNRDRFIQLGVAIAALRKLQGMHASRFYPFPASPSPQRQHSSMSR